MGARDMSVINTPPQDRLPITTFIAEPNDQTHQKCPAARTVARWQAYFIHNRVETIYDCSIAHPKTASPSAYRRGHGQMHSDEIDRVFHPLRVARRISLSPPPSSKMASIFQMPIRSSSTRADHFGMADLYQLRGRVGRWNRRAYAYFLIPNFSDSPEISRKRLNALAEASGYGGGMKVAMRDLEIRGAGNILGTEQSGHVSSIGFHLYCKLLKRTIRSLQGKVTPSLYETKIELPVDARLPEEYVNAVSLRMEVYHRFGRGILLGRGG